MKFGLGTVQFGMPYGISNVRGQVSSEEAREIINLARAHEIRLLDTAASYGDSEAVLGKILKNEVEFDLVTKMPAFSDSRRITANQKTIAKESFARSLKKLGCKRCYGLLIHHMEDLLKPGGELLLEALWELKQSGMVSKIGVSTYTPAHIEFILRRNLPVDIVQLPLNVVDQRLIIGGQLTELKAKKIEIHARSVFLQGLLLMSPEKMPSFFSPIEIFINDYYRAIKRNGLTPIEAAILFISCVEEVDFALIGVNSLKEFQQLLAAYRAMADKVFDFSPFALHDETFLNPVKWGLV